MRRSPTATILPGPGFALRSRLLERALLAALAAAALPSAPALGALPAKGYATKLAIYEPVRAGGSVAVRGRGAPSGPGIWVELWKVPAGDGAARSLGCVEAVLGTFEFPGISLAEGDAVYVTLSKSWTFEREGDAEGWDRVVHDAVLSVSGGALRVELRNLDGDATTDAYFQNAFRYDPERYRVVEVRLRNPASPEPSRALGIFWGAPFGTTIGEHNAEIPSRMAEFETILIPMNVAERSIVPGGGAIADGLWAAGALNDALRLDPLNGIPANDRSLDGTVFEIDHIRIREDYRRDFLVAGDAEGLRVRNDLDPFAVSGGWLSAAVADVGAGSGPPAPDGSFDPYFLGGLDVGLLEGRHFARIAIGIRAPDAAANPVELGILFDDDDSTAYRDDCPPPCAPAGKPIQEARLAFAPGARHDLALPMRDLTSPPGEWTEDGGRVRTASLRVDCPRSAAAGDRWEIDYLGWIPEEPWGPSDPALASPTATREVAFWDFPRGDGGWKPNAQTTAVEITSDGLEFSSTGNDPWVTSPSFVAPEGRALAVTVRMRSSANSAGQLFYGASFSEERSVRFSVVADGEWHEYALALPPQTGSIRLRLDPATGPGAIAIAWIRVEALEPIEPPELRPPERPTQGPSAPLAVRSGELELVHYRRRFGGFALRAGGDEVAAGHQAEVVGAFSGSRALWRELASLPVSVRSSEGPRGGEVVEEVSFSDDAGSSWTFRRRFAPARLAGAIDVEAEIVPDRTRSLVHVPWLTLFPGLGTYGSRKHQGLFAGLEYLSDEPSSSEADLTVPERVRRVPRPSKVTFPLMAIEDGGRYVGVAWERSEFVAPLFDSPDRVFSSGAHFLALWCPGVGSRRAENELFASAPLIVEGGSPLRARATILGGRGSSVVPAIQAYVGLRGLPPTPEHSGGFQGAVRLLAGGWLDSEANAGDARWRHAVWPGFGPQAASDAVAFLLWLARETGDAALRERIEAEAERALAARLQDDPEFLSGVSHVRPPMTALLFGNVPGHVSRRRDSALAGRAQFDAQGIRRYPQAGSDPKYGTTHFADHANGYAASLLQSILEAAALSGDATLVASALEILERETALYRNDVPRGAQTWEIALHTPDILASAYLLKCYVLAFELTGEAKHLEEARYWAWTGVPFVYLEPATAGPIGPYATVPVYGATNWVAPVWIGLPVQWCGLVYGAWLYRLARHDPEGPWLAIARGITATGLEMAWPLSDAARQGLLPDVFSLERQSREGPAINPGTVQATLAELYGRGSIYGFARAEELGWLIHAPGEISEFRASERGVRFAVPGWGERTYRVLLARVARKPEVIRTRPAGSEAPWTTPPSSYDSRNRWLVVELRGAAEVEVRPEAKKFIRADANASGEVDIADAISVLNFLFLGTGAPSCLEAADANDDGSIDISDALYLLVYLFSGGRAIPEPYPDCGLGSLAGEVLGCERHPPCA